LSIFGKILEDGRGVSVANSELLLLLALTPKQQVHDFAASTSFLNLPTKTALLSATAVLTKKKQTKRKRTKDMSPDVYMMHRLSLDMYVHNSSDQVIA
jgi:hypothetical protein